MMVNHAQNAQKFLSDKKMAKWHNQALWFVRQKRDNAVKSIDEWEALRQKAKEIKSHTLRYLRYYLQEFEKNAISNGIEVYWASDANECNEIVYKLIKQEDGKKVVKSKSMLTEECGLNPYLEQRGIEVTDTDLGERIVQLANQHPSHIVLPAIHLKKEQISSIFHDKMGTQKGNSDPEYLTKEARKDLRNKFLDADVAITGVNFALAKEGAITVCTNEGNADLGASIPNLHIACMGLEKVIPSAQELGVFTRVLARSATGQAITAYTSHFKKPKPNARLCVVIVDNGRSSMLHSNSFNALSCIRCGACMNTCPVYRRSGGHSYESVVPGPIGSVLNTQKNIDKYASLPFACSLCASCDNVCPVKIDLHNRLYIQRQEAIKHPTFKTKREILKLSAKIMQNPKLFAALMNIYRRVGKYIPNWIINSKYNIWAKHREMPQPAPKSFAQIYKEMQNEQR